MKKSLAICKIVVAVATIFLNVALIADTASELKK